MLKLIFTDLTLVGLAVGGSLWEEQVADQELFVRWLEIVALLPVMSFHTPPWDFGEDWVSAKSIPISSSFPQCLNRRYQWQ